ncbi:hypothetical protein L873DRAFT_1476545 [Choiromyces venosus 120613-1]|uniref:Uncharacterized protein n=1 Tax=Choiromyces venosus 120613-1 TaxID=1336337 RepID=A0A3N4JCL5_9PEZI|nr:hypothetical protein L873DRAFT_1476545 [Choiromyces venosus 120613-1]
MLGNPESSTSVQVQRKEDAEFRNIEPDREPWITAPESSLIPNHSQFQTSQAMIPVLELDPSVQTESGEYQPWSKVRSIPEKAPLFFDESDSENLINRLASGLLPDNIKYINDQWNDDTYSINSDDLKNGVSNEQQLAGYDIDSETLRNKNNS